MPQELYLLIIIDPTTGARLDTDEDEMTADQLDSFFANALEVQDNKFFGKIYRFGDGWYSYIEYV
jgi:hypothetical protein